jgi:hypothetical protein
VATSPRRRLEYAGDEAAPAPIGWNLSAASFLDHEEEEAQLRDFQDARLAILEKRRQLLAAT